jgi:phospholipid-binding lipoprotein MlaA
MMTTTMMTKTSPSLSGGNNPGVSNTRAGARIVSRWAFLVTAVSLSALMTGCATTAGRDASVSATGTEAATVTTPVVQRNPQDPFESFNRSIYAFNDGFDRVLLKPVATVYRDVTPRVARDGVGNFFSNLGDAWSFVNNVLQGRLEGSYNSMVRFSVNTVFGLGGLFDIASEMGVERKRQDFGQTLGRWGVPTGPYLVLPFMGPSTVRDTVALPVDVEGNLLKRIDDIPVRNSLFALRVVDTRSQLMNASNLLDSVALDKYSLTRDVYLRLRAPSSGGDGSGKDEYYDDGSDAAPLPPESK